MNFKITPARNSELTLLLPKFIVVDLYKIGTHEIANNAHTSQTSDVLKSLIKYGYKGPAISVIQNGSDDLYESILSNEFNIEEIEYGQLGVADGHNRLEALKELDKIGKLKTKIIPVQVFPGRKPEVVAIKVENPSERIWTIEEIESCFIEKDKTMLDSKNTSHFEAAFKDGVWRRIRESQPDIEIPKDELIS